MLQELSAAGALWVAAGPLSLPQGKGLVLPDDEAHGVNHGGLLNLLACYNQEGQESTGINKYVLFTDGTMIGNRDRIGGPWQQS